MKHFFIIITLLFICGCKTTKDKFPEKKTTAVIDDEVQRLDDIIENIDSGSKSISDDIRNIDNQADKITKSEVKTAIKLSAASINKSNESIKHSSKKIKDKVKPGLIKAKKQAIKTEQDLEDAQKNEALRKSLNRIIILCLFGLGISIAVSIKLKGAASGISEVCAYSFGGTLIGCSCYQWLMNNPWISGAITITFIAGGIIWAIVRHQKEIKEAVDLVSDDDKPKLKHCKKYVDK